MRVREPLFLQLTRGQFARDLIAQGLSATEAAIEATRRRFRPLVMTSVAPIFGVVPLLPASGAGAASQQALGTVVFGGMLASTLLAISFVPVFCVLLRRMGDSLKSRGHIAAITLRKARQ